MSPILGKRKRKDVPTAAVPLRSSSPSSDSDSGADTSQNLQDILRRHFEAKFAPLENDTAPRLNHAQRLDDDDSEEEGGDWDGIDDDDDDDSDEEQDARVIVIEHGDTVKPNPFLTKGEAKAFMTSKPPPTAQTNPAKKPHFSKPTPADTPADALNLKNDLALHRLISESHLLHPSSAPPARQKLLDHRLLALGSKSSILVQEKMPMAHRKGIVAKAAEREGRRRREAKENGIVLEKVARVEGKNGGERKRERGVTGPAAGKFKGATLKLSERDVRGIKGAGRKGKKR